LRKRILYFLIIPFLLILITIYYLNKFNKERIGAQFEKITVAEGLTIRNLVEVSGSHLINEGEEKLQAFLNRLHENKSIVYIGLFKKDELYYLLSRFEGYFPVVKAQDDFDILDSPIGKIFDIRGNFRDNSGTLYQLHIGFNYEFLNTFEQTTSRNFLIIAIFFLIIFLLVTGLIIYFDKKFFQAEWELEREKQEKERFKELSLLTAEIAHEIKNPLNSLYLSFNALEKYVSPEEDAVFYRDAIKGEVKRINTIIESYTGLSKEIRPEIRDEDLDRFASEFELFIVEEIKKNDAVLQVHTQKGIVMQTDPNLLKQVLFNLVKNSLQAGAKKLELSFETVKKTLLIRLKDDGRGIPKEKAGDIFKPYVSTTPRGMGLGLHIALKILNALSGEIKLISGEPGATIFETRTPHMREEA
jgi:signal transduction histidine kinase